MTARRDLRAQRRNSVRIWGPSGTAACWGAPCWGCRLSGLDNCSEQAGRARPVTRTVFVTPGTSLCGPQALDGAGPLGELVPEP